MSFLERLLGSREKTESMTEEQRQKLLDAWGLEATTPMSEPASESSKESESGLYELPHPLDLAYDRMQWRKRVKRVLDDLPDTEDEWEQVESEARAKEFDAKWVAQSIRDEFVLMVREAVADRVFTERERKKLEHARFLIGMSEADSEAIYEKVVAEAEAFFGDEIEGA
jgi:hypothetical protein